MIQAAEPGPLTPHFTFIPLYQTYKTQSVHCAFLTVYVNCQIFTHRYVTENITFKANLFM